MNGITANQDQIDAFNRVENAKKLVNGLYTGMTDDQVTMCRFYKHDVERFEDEYQKEMGWK